MALNNNHEDFFVDTVSGIGKVLVGVFFGDIKEQAAKRRKERAESLRNSILAGKRFRLEEMVSLLNHQGDLQTVDQIAVELELPVLMVDRAVKRWFFF